MILLVHGSWQRSHCWDQVTPLLRDAGAPPIAVDLRGAAPLGEQTLTGYTERIVDVVNALPEPATLVGHGAAGAFISCAAEQVPEKVSALVFVAAYLLGDSESVVDNAACGSSDGAAVWPSGADGGAASPIPTQEARAIFFHDCAPDVVASLLADRVPEARAPLAEPVQLSAERFGSVPKIYLETTQDRFLPLAAQRAMQRNWLCRRVITMETGHYPFVAQPAEFTRRLLGASGRR